MWRCNCCGANNNDNYNCCSICGANKPMATQKTDRRMRNGSSGVVIGIISALAVVCVCLALLVVIVCFPNTLNPAQSQAEDIPELSVTEPEAEADTLPSVQPEQEPEPAVDPAVVPLVTPTQEIIIESTITPYGKAMWDYKYNGADYSYKKIVSIISDTYYSRKNDQGVYYEGYSSGRNKDNEYGYDFAFYYGDGLLYYAEVRVGIPAEILVKLYFWDGAVVAVQDYRGDDPTLYYRGRGSCDKVAEEFSYVYSLGNA